MSAEALNIASDVIANLLASPEYATVLKKNKNKNAIIIKIFILP
jgi:hypothetical protein